MKYSVYQQWDPLKVCLVGKSYSPEFYRYIDNSKVRNVMERIAYETEEDYQKLIKLLESFNVKVMRPNVSDNHQDYIDHMGKIKIPPMTPRDYGIMLGNDFFFNLRPIFPMVPEDTWNILKGSSWPEMPKTYDEFANLPNSIIDEIFKFEGTNLKGITAAELKEQYPYKQLGRRIGRELINDRNLYGHEAWNDVLDHISQHANVIDYGPPELTFNSATTTRVGKDIYLGTSWYNQDISGQIEKCREYFPNYRWHRIDTGGHSDGTYCPVAPGLLVSLYDIPTYKDTFPDWEVVYLPGQSWDKVKPFIDLKKKNKGKWWVPGEELNDDFTDYVESWLDNWVGYVEETVFDVNMLVIDEKNVVCNNYNKEVFDTFARRGITPHVVNFRHRYFWDGGLHCITNDIHREGTELKDYFPERGDSEIIVNKDDRIAVPHYHTK